MARTIAAFLVLLVFLALVPASLGAVWLDRQLLTTDRYVESVAPLFERPELRDDLVEVVSTRVNQLVVTTMAAQNSITVRLLFQQLGNAVDVERQITAVVRSFVESEQFDTMWRDANRAAHPAVVAAFAGRPGPTIGIQGNEVVLDLTPVLARLRQDTSTTVGMLLNLAIPADATLTYTVLDTRHTPRIEWVVRQSGTLAIAVPAAAWAACILYLLLARRRLRALWWAGLGTTLVALGSYALADRWLQNRLDGVSDPASARLATSYTAALLKPLERASLWLAVSAFVVALVAGILALRTQPRYR